VLVLFSTSENKLLLQRKGPFEVLEHVEKHNYRIQLPNRKKVLHANLIKRYVPAVTKENNSPCEYEEKVTAAAILKFKEESVNQGPELETLNPLQKESVKNVKINPELLGQQQIEVKKLFQKFRNIFTNVPSITDLGEHKI